MTEVTGLHCLSDPWPPGDPCRNYSFLVCCIPSPVIGTLPKICDRAVMPSQGTTRHENRDLGAGIYKAAIKAVVVADQEPPAPMDAPDLVGQRLGVRTAAPHAHADGPWEGASSPQLHGEALDRDDAAEPCPKVCCG